MSTLSSTPTGRALERTDSMLVHATIEAQVAVSPDAVAVSLEGRSLTYATLDRQANQLAHRLRAMGVKPNVFVCVCLDRSLELVTALYAVLKAGGAYVPLDPDYPIERLRFMLSDSGAPVLITTRAMADRLGRPPDAAILVDEAWSTLASHPSTKPEELADREHLAYMIYTSGSTGVPKGALNPHRAVFNTLAWMRDEYKIDAASVILQKTPTSFDVSVPELFLPLMCGARMVLAKPGGHRDPAYLVDVIESSGVTFVQFVPSLLRVFLEQPDVERCRSVVDVTCIGEALSTDLCEAFFTRLSCGLHNLYGPTEAAVQVTSWDCRQRADTPTAPIGRPLPNCQVHILNDDLTPVAHGEVGELYIGGIQVGLGYHARPELTAERFVPDPFSTSARARLYKTGDLGRHLADGSILFLGRVDNQVKVRGFRVELGEIESVLASHPAVRGAVVTAIDDGFDGKRLIAYVATDLESEASRELEEPRAAENAADRLSQWQGVWERVYEEPAAQNRRDFNIVGWNSSYTREPIPEEDMREWVEGVTARIRALKPRRVLEIGCGSGLVLFRVAPACEVYRATDFSETVIAGLKPAMTGDLAHVELATGAAHQAWSGAEGAFNLVIINSVAQYFPSAQYLYRVIEHALSAVCDGGAIFVGDIRSLPLLTAFHTSVQSAHAPPTMTVDDLRRRVRRAEQHEEELVVSPRFFDTLPPRLRRISDVRIEMKRGRRQNELTRFRYDVTLYVDPRRAAPASEMAWNGRCSAPALRDWLRGQSRPPTVIRNVVNARVEADLRFTSQAALADPTMTIADVRRQCGDAVDGVEPEAIWALEREAPYTFEVSSAASGDPGAMDVIVRPKVNGLDVHAAPRAMESGAASPVGDGGSDARLSNTPMRAIVTRLLEQQLKTRLQERLPDYMAPTAFVYLDRLPLSPAGKVDRRALPPPDWIGSIEPASKPSDETETQMAAIWADLFDAPFVGRRANFFDLGGHSLLAAKLMTRIFKTFGKRIPLAAIFEAGTIQALAHLVRGERAVPASNCLAILTPGSDASLPPIFLVHALGGGVSDYLPIVRRLGADQRVIGVYAPLENGVPDWADSIERMAAHYSRELSEAHPAGPVVLGGWSGGVTVALEMAQQLRAQGRSVPLLIAIDASPENVAGVTPRSFLSYAWTVVRNLPYWVRDDLVHSGGADLVGRIRRKVTSLIGKLTAAQNDARIAMEVDGFFDLSLVTSDQRIFMERSYVAMHRYVPQHYDGHVLLVHARTQPLYHLLEPDRAWPLITDHLEVHSLACTHVSIVEEPFVGALAGIVRDCIKRINGQRHPNLLLLTMLAPAIPCFTCV